EKKGKEDNSPKETGRQIEIDGHKVRTVTGDFAVEVIADRAPLSASLDASSSHGMVKLTQGQKYQVWLYNYTTRWVLATVGIDGQSAFFLCTSKEEDRPTGFLIPPAKAGMPGVHKVKGYFRDAKHSLAFQVGTLAEVALVKDLTEEEREYFRRQS